MYLLRTLHPMFHGICMYVDVMVCVCQTKLKKLLTYLLTHIVYSQQHCDFKQISCNLPSDIVPSFGAGSGCRLCSNESQVPTTEYVYGTQLFSTSIIHNRTFCTDEENGNSVFVTNKTL